MIMAFAGSWAGIFTGIILFTMLILAEVFCRDDIIAWEEKQWKKFCRIVNRWIAQYERRAANGSSR